MLNRKMLGQRIRTARKEKGLTGEKLADACNINPTYLRQIEAGTKIPSLPMFVTICEALNASPGYLLADSFDEAGTRGSDPLYELCDKATPSQMRIITAMVKKKKKERCYLSYNTSLILSMVLYYLTK